MKKYNTEFKSMIVELYKTGRAVKDPSREYSMGSVCFFAETKGNDVGNSVE